MSIIDCHQGHSIVDKCRQEFGLLNKTVLHVLEQKVIFRLSIATKLNKKCCAVRILFFFFPSFSFLQIRFKRFVHSKLGLKKELAKDDNSDNPIKPDFFALCYLCSLYCII